MKKPNLYARAARRLERDPDAAQYPCWSIMQERGADEGMCFVDRTCLRFMAAFSNREGGIAMSEHFLEAMGFGSYGSRKFIEHSILALCFVAAMLDAGDLP